jgi:hypothetical protein
LKINYKTARIAGTTSFQIQGGAAGGDVVLLWNNPRPVNFVPINVEFTFSIGSPAASYKSAPICVNVNADGKYALPAASLNAVAAGLINAIDSSPGGFAPGQNVSLAGPADITVTPVVASPPTPQSRKGPSIPVAFQRVF